MKIRLYGVAGRRRVTHKASGTPMEIGTEEGKSPVGEGRAWASRYQSTTGHEESGGKQGRPLSKAKYYLMTDRGEVP